MKNEVHVLCGGVCDNDCLFCCERSAADGSFPAGAGYARLGGKPFLAPEDLRRRLAQLPPPERVLFEGGEPTCHPALAELIAIARERGAAHVGIITNGRRLGKPGVIEGLVEAGLDTVVFSIHGAAAQTHDALTRRAGSHADLLRGLRRALRLKATLRLTVMTNTVINKMNLPELPKLLRLLDGLGGLDAAGLWTMFSNGQALAHEARLLASLSESSEAVRAALDGLPEASRGRVTVAGIPPCLLGAHAGRASRFSPVTALGPDGPGPGHMEGRQGPPCRDCVLRADCDGVWPEYAARAGWGELRPVPAAEAACRCLLVGLRVDRERSQPPLALGCLKAFADEQPGLKGRVDVSILEAWAGEDEAALAARILAAQPTVVGFSCYVWNVRKVLSVCALIRRQRPDLFLVLGGPEASPRAEELLRDHPVSAVCVGEGEETFAELLERLAGGEALDGLAGLCRREGSGPPRAPIEDLSRLPSPYLSGVLKAEPGCDLALELSRGCPHGCDFCGWMNSARQRCFPPERALAEIAALRAQAPEAVCTVVDSDLFRSRARARALLPAMRAASDERGWSWVLTSYLGHWDGSGYPELDSERFFLLAGIQSTNAAALEANSRYPFDPSRNEAAVRGLRRAAPAASIQLEVILGLPGDTLEGFRATLDWCLSLPVDSVIVFQCLVLPGSGLWRKAESLGIVFDREPPYPVSELQGFPASDLEEGRFLSYAVAVLRRERRVRRAMAVLGERRRGERPFLSAYEALIAELAGRGLSLRERFRRAAAARLLSWEEPSAAERSDKSWIELSSAELSVVLGALKSVLDGTGAARA